MSLLEKIKADQLQARKIKHEAMASVLTTLIGEAVSIGKNGGNRETSDAEVVALIKKFIKNIRETQDAMDKNIVADTEATYPTYTSRKIMMLDELRVLTAYLPQAATSEQITARIIEVKATMEHPSMGAIMKELKAWSSAEKMDIDGALAGKLIKEQLL